MNISKDFVRISSIDGSPVDEVGLLYNLRLWLDTHFISAWYKNGDGYFIKFYGCDKFLKVVYD